MKHQITLTCEAGHSQTITADGMTGEMAEDYCGLLDGTSNWFVHPPGPESMLCKCCHPGCGRPYKATFVEIPNEDS